MNPLLTVNDGLADAAPLLQQLLDQGGTVSIPMGRYRLTKTLRVHSRTAIAAHPMARLFMDGETPKAAGDFLLTNDDPENGNSLISLTGGIWDGNNQGRLNTKGDILDCSGFSGAVLNFVGVRDLELKNLIVANSVTYNVRMARVDGFRIEDIGFLSDKIAFNQDGLHFGGGCRNGLVRRVSALSKGQTNDDLIALNADDSMFRVENVGLVRDAIENIVIEDVFAEDCHTIIRMLSVTSPIRNVTIRNVHAGYRCYAVNMDAARYCRTPLFKDDDHPQGVGRIENVLIDGLTCYSCGSRLPAVLLETRADNLSIRSFRLLNSAQAFRARNISGVSVRLDGQTHDLAQKTDALEADAFTDLTVSAIR